MRRAAWMLALCGLLAASGCVALVGGVDVPALEEGGDASTDVGADVGAAEGGDDAADTDGADADRADADDADAAGRDAAQDAASADAGGDAAIADAAEDEAASEAGGDASGGCGPCNTPAQCYTLPGTCIAGMCSYMPAGQGIPCDAGLCNGNGSCQ